MYSPTKDLYRHSFGDDGFSDEIQDVKTDKLKNQDRTANLKNGESIPWDGGVQESAFSDHHAKKKEPCFSVQIFLFQQ